MWLRGDLPVYREADAAVTLVFPKERYPQTAAHIADAIAHGESPICTLDRDRAEEHRKASLKGVPVKSGYDRDEWPMAMCAEGGAGADIAYIKPADNRGAGSWIANQLENYPDGTRVRIVVK
ncbi:NucA/NucB deoxyribonuclease domain-containing protein [Paenibacillus athensensis]|nr:NucA/NucB deoxyribonuclease domain-containing protein [Paenibacillus athensensis]